MSLAESLADHALTPLSEEDGDRLRTLTLANVAAGLGDLGRAGRLLAQLPITSSSDACFRMASRLHARTQDDFLPAGRSHLGAVALAAALTLRRAPAPMLLPSLAAGYRVMGAVSTAYGPIAQQRGLRPSSVFGPLGAAAAAGVGLGLDRDQVANAVALAGAQCGATNQAWLSGSDEWLLEIGSATRTGVEAALFTAAGAIASAEGLEGRAGWGAALLGDPGAPRLSALLKGGQDAVLRSLAGVAIKPYPISGIAQTPTAAATELHDLVPVEAIEKIIVTMSVSELAYPGTSNRPPFTSRSDALMSVAFCVACALTDGRVALARLERPTDPDVIRLADLVALEPDDSLRDGEVAVTVVVGGRAETRTATGERYLHPSWSELAGDVDALALRSEAPADQVCQARDELSKGSPDCRVLRQLLEAPVE